MKKIRNQKGVTLVALVVTIIVLIILAGISINLVLGDNGIITIAKNTKENTELAKAQEEKDLNELYTKIESSTESSSENDYQEYLCFPISTSGNFTAEPTIEEYSFLALGGTTTIVTDFYSSTNFLQDSVTKGDNRTTLRSVQIYVAYCKTNAKEKYLTEEVTISDGKAPNKDGYILLDLLRTGNVTTGSQASNMWMYNKITGECTNATYYAIYKKI